MVAAVSCCGNAGCFILVENVLEACLNLVTAASFWASLACKLASSSSSSCSIARAQSFSLVSCFSDAAVAMVKAFLFRGLLGSETPADGSTVTFIPDCRAIWKGEEFLGGEAGLTREHVLSGLGNLDQVFPKNELYVLHGSRRIGEFGAVWSKDQAVELSFRHWW